MEEKILMVKINKNNEIALSQFYEFFEQENIQYEAKLEDTWEGIRQPKYTAYISFYVNKKDKVKVRKFMEDLENADIQSEEYDELKISEEETQSQEAELKKYRKRQKRLQKIMIYGVFGIMIFGIIISIISNLKK